MLGGNLTKPTTVTLGANNLLLNATGTGKVGIGSAPAAASAVLEVTSTNKGVLLPRVALASATDKTTIANPETGLLVYNTGTAALKTTGYLYWNGTDWRTLGGTSVVAGSVGAIPCSGATLVPGSYTSGIAYGGILNVPYTGGNGGTYAAQSIGPVNGLTATLPAGNFATGAGTLTYTVTGTPTETSPTPTTFGINIGGKSCSAVVGEGDGISPGDLVFYRTSAEIPASAGGGGNDGTTAGNWLNAYQSNLPILGGKLRLDGYFSAAVTTAGTISFNPRLVNVSSSPVRFFFSSMTTSDHFNTANIVLATNGWVNLDNGVWNGYGLNDILSSPRSTAINVGQQNTEVITVDLSLDEKWYRIYYYPIVDNMNTTGTSDDMRKIYLSIQRLY
jgi:hypothetical protein